MSYEVGDRLKVFRSGEGTIEIEVFHTGQFTHPQARDGKGGYFYYENEWFWNGPKNQIYYTLNDDGTIKCPEDKRLEKV